MLNKSSQPCTSNNFHADHIKTLRGSYKKWTGRNMVSDGMTDSEAAEYLYNAPFALLSHNAEDSPIFTYANKTALLLFDLNWEQMTSMPSKHSAEFADQAEREALLNKVRHYGYTDDYRGIRISATGKRFVISKATVWNLVDDQGSFLGQAACFGEWTFLQGY